MRGILVRVSTKVMGIMLIKHFFPPFLQWFLHFFSPIFKFSENPGPTDFKFYVRHTGESLATKVMEIMLMQEFCQHSVKASGPLVCSCGCFFLALNSLNLFWSLVRRLGDFFLVMVATLDLGLRGSALFWWTVLLCLTLFVVAYSGCVSFLDEGDCAVAPLEIADGCVLDLGGRWLEFEFFHTNVNAIFFEVWLKFQLNSFSLPCTLTLVLVPPEKLVTPYLQSFSRFSGNCLL